MKNTFLFSFVFLFIFCSKSVLSEQKDTLQIAADDPVLAALDSMYYSALRMDAVLNEPIAATIELDSTIADQLKNAPDSIYQLRLDNLNAQSPIGLSYNKLVRAYIELYGIRKREVTSRILGLSAYYFPLFEEILDKHNLPLELKYLAIVESALNPTARSRAGATGLWQFMYRTGRLYKLKIDSYVDERRDPYKSTEAACAYFKFLYGMYGDWNLVLAAYNAGPGNVNKAIRRAGGKKDYWEIRRFLPRETRSYVPAFIAVNYIMNYHDDFFILPTPPPFQAHQTDTVCIKGGLSFEEIGRYTQLPSETIAALNPIYRHEIIPDNGQEHVLCLPYKKVGVFLANKDSIYKLREKTIAEKGYVEKEVVNYHTVRRGDFLGAIAQRHGCSVSDIKNWNNLRSSSIYPGQKLIIHSRIKQPVAKAVQEKKPPSSGEYLYHVVQEGDTLWDIAKKYDGVSLQQLKELNRDINAYRLKRGQKIKIGVKG